MIPSPMSDRLGGVINMPGELEAKMAASQQNKKTSKWSTAILIGGVVIIAAVALLVIFGPGNL